MPPPLPLATDLKLTVTVPPPPPCVDVDISQYPTSNYSSLEPILPEMRRLEFLGEN